MDRAQQYMLMLQSLPENDAGDHCISGEGMANDKVGRANWKDPEILKLFLDLCLEEVTNRGRNVGSLKIESWNNIEKILFEKKGFKFNQKQLKNHWDYLKKKYTVWSNLVRYTSGNDTLNWPNLSSLERKRWDDYIKENPDARQFRQAGLPYTEEMKSLFGSVTTNGTIESVPSKEGVLKNGVGSSSSSQVPTESLQTNIGVDCDTPHVSSPKEGVLKKGVCDTPHVSSRKKGVLKKGVCDTPHVSSPKEGVLKKGVRGTPQVSSSKKGVLKKGVCGTPHVSSPKEGVLKNGVGSPSSSQVPTESVQTNIGVGCDSPHVSSPKEGMLKNGVGSSSSSQVPMESLQTNIDVDCDSPHVPSSLNGASLTPTKRKENSGSSDLDAPCERVLKSIKESHGPTLKECNLALDAMKQLDIDDPLYVAACSIFCESETRRKQWMILSKKPEEIRMHWIRMNAKEEVLKKGVCDTPHVSSPKPKEGVLKKGVCGTPHVSSPKEGVLKNGVGSPSSSQVPTESVQTNIGVGCDSPHVSSPKEGVLKNGVGSSSSSQVPMESLQTNIDVDCDSPHVPSSLNGASLTPTKRKENSGSCDLDAPSERVLKSIKESHGPTLTECNLALDAMKQLDIDDPLYVAACSIFCESETHRKQWMILSKKPEEIRMHWIRMNAKRLGLI